MSNLQTIYLNFNLIEDLPDGAFADIPNLFGLWEIKLNLFPGHFLET